MSQFQKRKRLGQHFLRHPAVVQDIVNACDPQADDCVVEIGPGEGVLTETLCELAGELHLIELDDRLIPILQQRFPQPHVHIHHINALDFDYRVTHDKKIKLIGNLPYNISTPLLFHLIERLHAIKHMTFMLQQEVADRLLAAAGSKAYGRLSVMVQWHCDVQRLLDIPPEAFEPPPKVNSTVVQLYPRSAAIADVDLPTLEHIVTAIFSQRRKVLRNTLKMYLNAEQISALGIDPQARGEQLSLAQLAKLAQAATDPTV